MLYIILQMVLLDVLIVIQLQSQFIKTPQKMFNPYGAGGVFAPKDLAKR